MASLRPLWLMRHMAFLPLGTLESRPTERHGGGQGIRKGAHSQPDRDRTSTLPLIHGASHCHLSTPSLGPPAQGGWVVGSSRNLSMWRFGDGVLAEVIKDGEGSSRIRVEPSPCKRQKRTEKRQLCEDRDRDGVSGHKPRDTRSPGRWQMYGRPPQSL